jgi:hypothetical protein
MMARSTKFQCPTDCGFDNRVKHSETILTNNLYTSHTNKTILNKTINVFIQSVVCLTTGPYPLPKRVLHRA